MLPDTWFKGSPAPTPSQPFLPPIRVPSTMYVDTGLTPSTSYTYQVRAMQSATDSGPWSADASAMTPAAGTTVTPPVTDTPADATIDSSSTSASAAVELKLAVKLTVADVAKLNKDGGSIELTWKTTSWCPIQLTGTTCTSQSHRPWSILARGGRVRAQYGVVVNDGDFYDGDDDWAIQVFIPDLQETVGDGTVGTGFQGPTMGDTITLVITQPAGIKNPSEAGTHSVGFKILGPNDEPDKGGAIQMVDDVDTDGMQTVVKTLAKIGLSDEDNVRGYDLTVTGSGFNNDVTADVYVLSGNDAVWDTLNCAQMNLAVGQMGDDMDTEGNGFCRMYADMTAAEKTQWTIWTSATIRPKLQFARASSPKAPTPAAALWAATTRSPPPLR